MTQETILKLPLAMGQNQDWNWIIDANNQRVACLAHEVYSSDLIKKGAEIIRARNSHYELLEVFNAAKSLMIASAPMTESQEVRWPRLKAAIAKAEGK